MEGVEFDYVWNSRLKLPERTGQECRVVDFDRTTNEAHVEFRDGVKRWVSRGCVRRKRGSVKR